MYLPVALAPGDCLRGLTNPPAVLLGARERHDIVADEVLVGTAHNIALEVAGVHEDVACGSIPFNDNALRDEEVGLVDLDVKLSSHLRPLIACVLRAGHCYCAREVHLYLISEASAVHLEVVDVGAVPISLDNVSNLSAVHQ